MRDEGVEMRDKGGGLRGERGEVRDPWKILWIWIRQNDADPLDHLDPDPQHCFILLRFYKKKIENNSYSLQIVYSLINYKKSQIILF